jgi:RNA polymerase sigma-70 factor, ECF subfamily
MPLDRDEAFALVCRHMRTISRLQGPELEDMVQMAAEQVLRRLDSFEGRSAASTWIFRICYNVFLNQRRLYKRWLRRFTLTASGALPEVADAGESASRLEGQERSARLHAALDAMSPKLSTVVVLHDLKDLAIDEIAALLEIKDRTARSRLRNGRLELRRRLGKDPYFGRRSEAGGAP